MKYSREKGDKMGGAITTVLVFLLLLLTIGAFGFIFGHLD